jgi:hypothetical protein
MDGATHFLTRIIERVSTEMSLHVLAYNMKRVIKLLGSETLMKAMGGGDARTGLLSHCDMFDWSLTFVLQHFTGRDLRRHMSRQFPVAMRFDTLLYGHRPTRANREESSKTARCS